MMKTLGGAFLNLYPTETYWKGAILWTILFFFRFASRHHHGCDFQNRIRTCKTLVPFIIYFLCMLLLFFNRVVFKDRQARRGHQEPPVHPELQDHLDHPGHQEGVHVDGSSVLGRMGQARMARTLVLFT